MPGRTMIIGLPDLISKYFFVFNEALHKAKEDRNVIKQEQQVKILKRNKVNAHLHLVEESLANWVTKPAEISPEELAKPEPCSFTGPLHYLSMSHEQAVQEYVFESWSAISSL
jgi:hypothetical protein